MTIMEHIYCYRVKELCIKLVIEASLYNDTRSETHQIMPCRRSKTGISV